METASALTQNTTGICEELLSTEIKIPRKFMPRAVSATGSASFSDGMPPIC